MNNGIVLDNCVSVDDDPSTNCDRAIDYTVRHDNHPIFHSTPCRNTTGWVDERNSDRIRVLFQDLVENNLASTIISNCYDEIAIPAGKCRIHCTTQERCIRTSGVDIAYSTESLSLCNICDDFTVSTTSNYNKRPVEIIFHNRRKGSSTCVGVCRSGSGWDTRVAIRRADSYRPIRIAIGIRLSGALGRPNSYRYTAIGRAMADTAAAALDDDDVELPLAPPLEESGELPDEEEDEEEDAHAAGEDLQPAEQPEGGEGDQEGQSGVRCTALRPAPHRRSGASRVTRDAGRSRLHPATRPPMSRGCAGSVLGELHGVHSERRFQGPRLRRVQVFQARATHPVTGSARAQSPPTGAGSSAACVFFPAAAATSLLLRFPAAPPPPCAMTTAAHRRATAGS